MARSNSTSARGSMLASQASLPQLPVPSLEQTLQKYLRSTEPHQTPETLAATKQAVESALSGKDSALVKELQTRLQARANEEGRENWLADWWNEAAYMAYRDPVVPYVSYFYAHADDKSRRNAPARAASQLKAMLQFRKLVESEQLSPEKTKTGAMCMSSYKWMFNSCRIPAKPADVAEKYDPATHNHVVVLRGGKYWEFDLVHDGQELSTQEIESQIARVLADPAAQSPEALPVGALTSDNRDKWTESREALLKVGGGGGAQNREALERIQSSVILLCLDESNVVTREDVSWHLWAGDAKNRFYDKQQLIVFPNGKSGFMGEHSTMDGTPTLRLNDFMLSALAANKIDHGSSSRSLPAPKAISFSVDRNVESLIKDSLQRFNDLMGRHELAVLDYQGYGKNAIKAFKCSPDAWVQMVIQLAYYKMYGKPAPTYESAQTRKFKLGRTETIRSASVESKAFCEAMEDVNGSDAVRLERFQAAVKQHLAYATAAADGQGVDRHLFGLKKVLKEGEKLPEIYNDPAFALTSTWLLSTSQISSESFDCWGFGEVSEGGYGCAYAIKNDSLTFTLTSLKLRTTELRHHLNEAANELRALHQRAAAAQQKPKL